MASMTGHFFERSAGAVASGQWPGRGSTPKRGLQTRERRAFTLIELLTVIAIIGLITALTVPALRALGKSNDQSQAANLVRSMISNARSIAISQHRLTGVVFFEESATYSRPVHGGQVAMQLIVEAFDQTGVPAPAVGFVYYNTARQYIPTGVRLASLTDALGANVETGDTTVNNNARCILFDGNGQLVLQKYLATQNPTLGGAPAGIYPMAYGDWKFLKVLTSPPKVARWDDAPFNADLSNVPSSSPGFFLFNKAEYEAQKGPNDAQTAANRIAWLKKNATVIIVNGNTGGVLR